MKQTFLAMKNEMYIINVICVIVDRPSAARVRGMVESVTLRTDTNVTAHVHGAMGTADAGTCVCV